MKIIIAISTRNRKHEFRKCYREWLRFLPEGAEIVVVDDASTERYALTNYYFKERVGIPAVKNKCLEICMDKQADHIFLVDDDVFAINENWYKPYINSPYGHLSFTFTNAYQNMPAKNPGHEKDFHIWNYLSNGCVMYVTPEVVNKVGGFRTEYGLGTYDHIDYSNRVYASGLIPHPFIDVIGSSELFYSLDAHNETTRSFTEQERAKLIQRNYAIFASKRFDTNFVPYDTHR